VTRRLTETRVVFAVAFAAYVGVALVLALHYRVIVGDALARVANASFMVQGRDPHAAAVGFVWNPLPSIVAIPLVLLRPLIPAMTTLGLAGAIVSAAFMAGAVANVVGFARELGASRPTRLVVAGLFAVHPLTVFYAGNGMSEAPFICLLLWSARTLARWARTDDARDLLVGGIALGLAYLTRYEAIAALAAGAAVVGVVTWRRTERARRRARTTTDVTLLLVPGVLAVGGWSLASWVIVGHPVEQLSSQYGNATQVASLSAAGTALSAGGRLAMFGEQAVGFFPLFLAAVAALLVGSVLRRDARAMAAAAIVTAPLALQALLIAGGMTVPWSRYAILVVPAGAVAVVGLVALIGPSRRPVTGWIGAAVAVAIAAPALPGSVRTLTDDRLASDHRRLVAAVRDGWSGVDRADQFDTQRAVAARLDRMGLPEGSVLLDVSNGFGIVLASRRPSQFVITPDRDFEQALADPHTFGVRYLLTPDPTAANQYDALSAAYPNLYATGGGVSTEVAEFPGDGDRPSWRLLRTNPSNEFKAGP
jgi:hypothetical protein